MVWSKLEAPKSVEVTEMNDWVDSELEAAQFPDQRLKSRLSMVLRDLGERIGATTPLACQDWAATKTAYRTTLQPGEQG